MSIRFTCPKCGMQLALKDEFAGHKVRCPKCKEVTTAPNPPAPVPITVPPPALPAAAAPTPITVAPTDDDLPRTVAQWQQALPAYLESQYVPSGRTSAGAVGAMVGAMVPGIVCGWVVTALTLLLTWVVCAGLFQVTDWLANMSNRILIILPLMISFLALVGLGLACVLGGAAVAAVVTEIGKWQKNRNRLIPALLSAAAAVPTLLTATLWLGWTFRPWLAAIAYLAGDVKKEDLVGMGESSIVTYLTLAFCFLGAAVTAVIADRFVQDARFCETCQEFHKAQSVYLPLVHAPELAAILDARNFTRLQAYVGEAHHTLDSLHESPAVAGGATPGVSTTVDELKVNLHCQLSLYLCPGCGEGYLEADAHAEEVVKADTKEKKEENWKFRSLAVSAEEGDAARKALFADVEPKG